MLNEQGKFVDDCVIYRTGPNAFMVVHGTGIGYEMLSRSALGRQVAILFDDDLHDLSLQGPLAVDYLAEHVPGIRDLAYFHHIQTRLFGAPVMISRTGYTGERGYEIFCKAADAAMIWETILKTGQAYGIVPCSFTTLDWLRTESYLLFFPYDNSEYFPFEHDVCGDTLWELGLDFTVSPDKGEFRGCYEHRRLKDKARFKIFGVLLEGQQAPAMGDTLWDGDQQVGVITCGMHSPLTQQTVAIARLALPYAEQGKALQVKGSVAVNAIAHTLPFDDPQKLKRTAKG